MENYNSVVEEYRPSIKMKTTILHRIMDGISLTLIIGVIAYGILRYNELPNMVPVHFSFSGEFDSVVGDKTGIFIFIGLGIIFYIVSSFFSKFPDKFTYSIELTEENVKEKYMITRTNLKALGLEIIIFFSYIQYNVINSTIDGSNNVGNLYLGIGIMILVTAILYKVRIRK